MTNTITYKNSGVDINAGNALVPVIKSIAQHTQRPEVLTGIGGFGALCELPPGYKQPVLVSGTDGVGTKLKLALDTGRLEGIGIDLVAMCANDILVSGAQPLFFLDYYATSQLDLKTAETIIRGIGVGCKQAGCALVGGETAEMPGLYAGSDFDLAGFCVGVVEKSEIITGDRVKPGDTLIALASSGPHSNGYSLIRAILRQQSSDQMLEGKPLLEHLIMPTRIYVQSILALMKQMPIHAMAHITGGGIVDNLPRTLPDHVTAIVDRQSWRLPPVFQWLQKTGPVDDQEMLNTFNCGVGMIVCVARDQATSALDLLESLGETAWRIGEIVERDQSPVQFS